MAGSDGERRVDFLDGVDVLPDITGDESPEGWGEYAEDDSTARLIDDRPPHWDSAF